MRTLILSLLCMASFVCASSTMQPFNSAIVDEDNTPLADVNVLINGLSAYTNKHGQISVDITPAYLILYQHI